MKLNKFGYILSSALMVAGLSGCWGKKEVPAETQEMAPPAEGTAAPTEGAAPAEGTETAPAETPSH